MFILARWRAHHALMLLRSRHRKPGDVGFARRWNNGAQEASCARDVNPSGSADPGWHRQCGITGRQRRMPVLNRQLADDQCRAELAAIVDHLQQILGLNDGRRGEQKVVDHQTRAVVGLTVTLTCTSSRRPCAMNTST